MNKMGHKAHYSTHVTFLGLSVLRCHISSMGCFVIWPGSEGIPHGGSRGPLNRGLPDTNLMRRGVEDGLRVNSQGAEHEGRQRRRLSVGRGGRPTRKFYLSRDEVSGRERGRGESLFGVLGHWEPDRKAESGSGKPTSRPESGAERSGTGELSMSGVTDVLRNGRRICIVFV